MKKIVLTSLVLAGVFVGCSDPKEASNENFEKAINAHYEKECIKINAPLFPKEVSTQRFDETNKQELDELVKVGLLKSTSKKVKDTSMLRNIGGNPDVDGFEYTLTEDGKKVYSSISEHNNHFCAGKNKVSSIENFTEPSDMFGMTLSKVMFKKQATNVPTWAKELVKNENYKRYADELSETPTDDKTELILTNNGWSHKKDMK